MALKREKPSRMRAELFEGNRATVTESENKWGLTENNSNKIGQQLIYLGF